MEEKTELAVHNHVNVAVEGSGRSGVEPIPAKHLEDGNWMLLRSPLYALQLAAGDTIRVSDLEAGTFEVVEHGGNVAIQFYLSENESDDQLATANTAKRITPDVVRLGGRMDGQTTGLIVYTLPVEVGFPTIEKIFNDAANEFPGAQWQYSNVYDMTTGESLRWWE